jgi:hypothetical protein
LRVQLTARAGYLIHFKEAWVRCGDPSSSCVEGEIFDFTTLLVGGSWKEERDTLSSEDMVSSVLECHSSCTLVTWVQRSWLLEFWDIFSA